MRAVAAMAMARLGWHMGRGPQACAKCGPSLVPSEVTAAGHEAPLAGIETEPHPGKEVAEPSPMLA